MTNNGARGIVLAAMVLLGLTPRLGAQDAGGVAGEWTATRDNTGIASATWRLGASTRVMTLKLGEGAILTELYNLFASAKDQPATSPCRNSLVRLNRPQVMRRRAQNDECRPVEEASRD